MKGEKASEWVKGSWIYAKIKLDWLTGNTTADWRFFPDLNAEIFTGKEFLIDIYNACRKSVETGEYVGNFYSNNPKIDFRTALDICSKAGFYKGEAYATMYSTSNTTERLVNFSNEPVNEQIVGFGADALYYSTNLFVKEEKTFRKKIDIISKMAGY